MNANDRPRPVSGEIMTSGEQTSRSLRLDAGDFAEAEYEEVEGRRSAPAEAATAPAATGLDSLKPGKSASASWQPGGPVFWTASLAIVAAVFWVSGGHALVRSHGPTALRSVPALAIGAVESRVERHGGRSILFVDGDAENRGGAPRSLPPIEISVVGNDGRTTRYVIGTGGDELAPGDRYRFSSRFEAPSNGVKTISVAFRQGEQ